MVMNRRQLLAATSGVTIGALATAACGATSAASAGAARPEPPEPPDPPDPPGLPGTARWRFQTGPTTVLSLVAADGAVYAGVGNAASAGAGTYAINAATGKKIWSKAAAAGLVPQAAGHGAVFCVGIYDICAVSGATGRVLWTYAAGAVNVGGASTWLAYAGDTVFTTSGLVTIPRTLTITDDVVCGSDSFSTTSAGHAIFALDRATGSPLWRVNLGAVWPVTVGGDLVYAVAGAAVWALHVRSGKPAWKRSLAGQTPLTPFVADATVYVGTNGRLYALAAATGRERWSFATAGVVNALAAADGTVYAASSGGQVYALRA
jgi:outer membrane protein assembly factor BamB